jgi:hypothetical protein
VGGVLAGDAQKSGAGGEAALQQGEAGAVPVGLPHDQLTIEDQVGRQRAAHQPGDVGKVDGQRPSGARLQEHVIVSAEGDAPEPVELGLQAPVPATNTLLRQVEHGPG